MTSKRVVVVRAAIFLWVVAFGMLFLAPWLSGGSPHKFTDLLGTKLSPDGKIMAAFVVESRGFASPTTFAITLSQAPENPLDARPIITEGEYRDDIWYEWSNAKTLTIRLPCGWWANLTNHYQATNSDQIVDIDFLPPKGCRAVANGVTTGSSTVPNTNALQGRGAGR